MSFTNDILLYDPCICKKNKFTKRHTEAGFLDLFDFDFDFVSTNETQNEVKSKSKRMGFLNLFDFGFVS